ncbi:MAG: response regulator transcription factor [Bacteroidetes bacterium]|nr:MAG: response regulator transcription factor [Bacteroidota bacterium]
MRYSLLLGPLLLCFAAFSSPQQDKHTEVSLRMIGHQMLLAVGDSTSRVLPIENDGESYRIRFATEFGFNPDEVAGIIDSVVASTQLATSYNVAFQTCHTKETVHMYEVGMTSNENVLACLSRDQPVGCYELVFTIKDAPAEIEVQPTTAETLKEYASSDYREVHKLLILLVIVLLILLATVAFLLKRIGTREKEQDPNDIRIGSYVFNPIRMELKLQGQPVELTSKESDLLQLLCNSANDTVDRETILRTVWGDDGDYIGRTLDVFISKLRKKLEADPNVKIANIRGVGYKLIVDQP